MTQHERILKYCDDFGSITSYEAYIELGITQLATRIKELEETGITFERKREKKTNRYGEKVSFVRYSRPSNKTEWIINS